MGIFNEQSFKHPFAKGIQGAPGVGFRLTADGNYDMSKKRLTNVGAPSDNADAATKKYVDDNRESSGGPSKTSTLTIDSNIDMKDRFRILNLKHPVDADEPATKQYSDSRYLDRDGSRTMIGNLDLNNNKIIKVGAPTGEGDAATKKYVDDTHTNSAVKTSKLVVDSNIDMKSSFRIRNLQTPLSGKEPPTKDYVDNTFLDRDGSYPMKGNLKMDNNRITGLPAPNSADQPTTLTFSNLKYLARNGSAAMTNNLNMNNKKIINLSSPSSNTDAATKKYVDDAAPDLSDYLEKDGSVAMIGNLNMNNKKIVGLVGPTSASDAATKKYVDDNRGSGGGSGDFKKDGSVAMTGNLNMGSNRIVSLADPTNASDAANKSWVRKQIQHFDVLASPVFTVTSAPAYSTIFLQHHASGSGRFVFTTSRPGQALVAWKPASGIYVNKIVFNFGRKINVTNVSFVARDSNIKDVDFWVSHEHTGLWTLNVHRTWAYELSGVFLYYSSDASSSHPAITSNVYTGKPSATTRNFKKITFNVPTEFTAATTAATLTTSSGVATKSYVDNAVAGPPHYQNVFEYLYSSASQWTDEISSRTSFTIKKIGYLPPADGNFHSYNYRAINLGLNKYSGGYNFKMGVNFYRLAAGDYTICFELLNTDYTLWHKTQVSLDHQTSTGISFLSESIKKESYTYVTDSVKYMYYHRIIVSFNKAASGGAFLHLAVNMPQVGSDMISYPSEFTDFYVIVYGVRGSYGNVDPDRSFDYHTAFDIEETEVSYNVNINANNHSITNLAADQNTTSAATVGMINELKYFSPYHFYLALFDEIFFFNLANYYVFTTSSASSGASSITINKIKSIKGTSAVAIPNKNYNQIKPNGLDVVNYTLDLPLPDNIKNLTLLIVFYFWSNRDFQLVRWDTAGSGTKLSEINYFSSQNRIVATVGRQRTFITPQSNLNGKKIILLAQHTSINHLYLWLNEGSYLRLTGTGGITAQKQKITFLTKGGIVNKIMYTDNLVVDYDKVLLQEYFI